MTMRERICRYGFTDQHGQDAMKCEHVLALLDLWEEADKISGENPYSTWDYASPYGLVGWGNHGDADFVDDPDEGNNDDIHNHGRRVGEWNTAVRLRKIMTPNAPEVG